MKCPAAKRIAGAANLKKRFSVFYPQITSYQLPVMRVNKALVDPCKLL